MALSDVEKKSASIFQNRDFMLLWAGQTISRLGDGLHQIGLVWLVFQQTGSSAAMAGVLIATTLPALLFGLVAGVYVDRWSRKEILIWTDIIRAVLVLAIPILWSLGYLTLVQIYIVTFLLSSASQFFNPAFNASVPNLVTDEEQLLKANSLSQLTFTLAGIIGMAIVGFLIDALGIQLIFSLDAASFAFAAIMASKIRMSLTGSASEHTNDRPLVQIWRQSKEGFSYIQQERLVLTLLLTGLAVNFFLGPINIVLPLYSEDVLGSGAEGFGLMGASISAGMLLGSLITMQAAERFRKTVLIALGLSTMGVTFAALGFIAITGLAILLTFILGVGVTICQIPIVTILQNTVPDDKRGRVFSVLNATLTATMPLSAAIAGIALEQISSQAVFRFSGAAIACCAIVFFLIAERRFANQT